MSLVKKTVLVALSAMALTGLVDATASATTLEIGGVALNQAIEFEASLEPETSSIWQATNGTLLQKCAKSPMLGKTETKFTIPGAAAITGKLTSLTFEGCTQGGEVPAPGGFSIEWVGKTTGTVRSSGTEVKFKESLGFTLTCTTPANTDIGLLTGVKEGNATLEINVVLNCGFFQPSVRWLAAYTVTSPKGLGVSE